MLQKLQSRGLISFRGNYRFQYLAFVIDSPPKIAEPAIDLHEHLVQMPPPLRIAAHVRETRLPDLASEHRTKSIPPEPHRLVAYVDPALGQEILDVTQRQRVPHVHHHDQTDHFWRTVEVSERIFHSPKYLSQTQSGNRSDSTPGRGSNRLPLSRRSRRP